MNSIYKHINDCWTALRNATCVDEAIELMNEFPRWSGDWNITIENGKYVIYNIYWEYDTEQTDREEFDFKGDIDND